MNDFGYLVRFPVVEVILGAFWLGSVFSAWAGAPTVQQTDDVAERTLGATVVMGQLSAVITGSSIILAGVGAFAALSSHDSHLPQPWHLWWAVVWAVLALCNAAYTMATLPTRTLRRNFVRDRGVAICCATALFFCLASGARFLCALSGILLGTI